MPENQNKDDFRRCAKCDSDDIHLFKSGTVTTRIRCKRCGNVWSHGAVGHSKKRVRTVIIRGERKKEVIHVPRHEKAAGWHEDPFDRRSALSDNVHDNMGALHDE